MGNQSTSTTQWKNYFQNQIYILNNNLPIYYTNTSGPILLCLHGAGHSALSFSLLAKISKNLKVISFDFRGHGYNKIEPKDDLSIKTLISETENVLFEINKLFPNETIIILGHSLGGAVATKTICDIFKNKINNDLYVKIQGLIVIDVIEGTAMDALPKMIDFINKRKNNFHNINDAIYYMVNKQIKNLESCKISIPPLLKEGKDEKGEKVFQWKTDLISSEKFWKEWYINLSNDFLSIKIPKCLILNDTNELDTPLTIGHMQGKFKLVVIKETGHFIHEDDPKSVICNIEDFINSFKLPKSINEVKEMENKLGNIEKYTEFKG